MSQIRIKYLQRKIDKVDKELETINDICKMLYDLRRYLKKDLKDEMNKEKKGVE